LFQDSIHDRVNRKTNKKTEVSQVTTNNIISQRISNCYCGVTKKISTVLTIQDDKFNPAIHRIKSMKNSAASRRGIKFKLLFVFTHAPNGWRICPLMGLNYSK
jgi:hypothetical protein